MIRAQYKDEKYFEKYMYSQEERIKRFKGALLKIDKDDIIKNNQCKNILSGLYFDMINAKYSLGLQKEEILSDVNELFKYITEISSYNDLISFLSLSIIFDIDKKSLNSIAECNKYDDALVEELKNYVFNENTKCKNAELMYPNDYGIFLDFLNKKVSTDEFIEYMDNDWYASCKECYFYDSHKTDNETYTGYWSWLAAAILKMMAINNAACRFIPSDLIYS